MSELATAYVSLVVETKDIAKGVSQHFSGVEKEADKAGKSAGGKLKSGFVSGVKDLGKALLPAMGAAALVAGFKDIIGGASELEQSIGGVQAVFEGNADVITKASKEAAKNLGLSRDEYNKLATTLGAGLKNKGIEDYAGSTQDLIKIGGDLAAQFGGSTQEAVEALSSAMRGESDPIEKYGVALNETAVNAKLASMSAEELGGATGEQAKTMARLAIIAEQTADAQGAFGRESETAAGRQAILAASFENIKTTVGTALLPAFSGVVNAISDFVSGMDQGTGAGGRFKEIALQVKDAVMGVVDFVTKYKDIIIPLAGGILAVVAAMQAWQAITTAVAAVQGVLNAVMSANPIGIVVLAIVGLVAALVLAYKNSETFRDIVNGAWAAVKSGIGAVVSWFTGTAWPAIKGAWDALAAAATALWQSHVKPAWESIKGGIEAVVSWLTGTAWPAVKTVFDGIGAVVSWLWGTIIQPYFTLILGIWTTVFSWIRDTGWPIVKGAFDLIGAGAKALWDQFIKPAFDNMKAGVEVVVDAFGKAKDAIGKAWSGLKDAVSGPIKAALSWISDNFIDPLNSLLDKVGIDFRLPTFSTGGAVGRSTAGGVMLAAGGRVPGFSPNDTADNIPAWLTAGEYVLPRKATRSLRARFGDGFLEALRRGLPGYAGGGLVDSIKGAASGAWDLVKMAADALKDPAGVVAKIVSAVVPGGGIFPEVASGVLKRVIDAVVGKIRDFAASLTSAGVDGGSGGPAAARVLGALLPGLTITSSYRDAERNARVGGRAGSLHMDRNNPALDIGGPTALLDQMYKILVGMGGWRELLWRVAGHYDHIHVAAQGGLVPPFVADSGVTLAPGLNLLDNKLGRPEPLARTDQGFGDIHVHLEVEDLRALRTVEDFVAMVGVRSRMQAGVR